MTDQTDHRAMEIAPKVEIAPNWEQTARMLVVILRDGTPDGKAHAESEVIRMLCMILRDESPDGQAYAASEVIRIGQIIDQLQAERGREATGPGFPL